MNSDSRFAATLRTIQPGTSGMPLYLVHEVFGSIDCYIPLGNALGPDQPVFAFQQPDDDRHRNIKELAAIYLRDLQEFDPLGPYILGGYSFGGLVAFEMAQLLYEEGAGDRVAFVVMFDAWVPSVDTALSLQDKWRILGQTVKKSGVQYIFLKIRHKVAYSKRMYFNKILNFTGSTCERIKCNKPSRVRKAEIERANIVTLMSYRPSPYEGKVLLMLSSCRQTSVSKRGDPT